MKKLYAFFLLFIVLSLSSCLDVEERFDFKEDGSCKVVYGFDMSRAVSVFMNLMTDSLKETPEFNIVKDTSLNFYSALPDSVQKKLGAEEMLMTMNSDLAIKMDLKNSLMRVDISHLAKNADELQYYLEHLSKISLNNQFDQMTKATKGVKDINAKQLMSGQDYYDYKVTPTKFIRIIDKVKFNSFLKKTQNTLAMAKAMLIDMPYKVVLNFAHPVKSVSNPKAVISDDKKQVTLITTMDEIIKDPTVMNISIDH